MQIQVQIAATTETWRLGRGDELALWLERRPWQGGEICSARSFALGRAAALDPVVRKLSQLLHAADEGYVSPKVFLPVILEGTSLPELLSASIFGAPRDLNNLELKRLLMDRLERSPQIFLLADAFALAPAITDLLASLNNTGSAYPLIVLDFRTGSRRGSHEEFELYPAMPAHAVLRDPRADPETLWQRYLHSRGAWESGGSIAFAERLGMAWSSVPTFDDNAVETASQEVANQQWLALPESVRKESAEYGGLMASAASARQVSRLVFDLLAAGVLWYPPGHGSYTPAAWAVRGRAPSASSLSPVDRAALVNAPLVAELLSGCFHLEALERARLPEPLSAHMSSDASEMHQSFLRREPRSQAVFYPDTYLYRATPENFESFGSCIGLIPRDEQSDARKRLLALRNALCHGHFAGWYAVKTFSSVQERLLADRISPL